MPACELSPVIQPAIPPPVFLGFCLKAYQPRPVDWLKDGTAAQVRELCSVSDCIVGRPPAWVERWDFNRASCWNDEVSALTCAPMEAQDNYRLYAYRAIPLVFGTPGVPVEQSPQALFSYGRELVDMPPEPDLTGYECLGYDVVEHGDYLGYGCSPLSCNGLAAKYPANRYCLLDSLAAAYAVARTFGVEGPEPGPYIIVDVLRKGSDTVSG